MKLNYVHTTILNDCERIEDWIKDLIKRKESTYLRALMTQLTLYILLDKPEITDELAENFGKFLAIVPYNISTLWVEITEGYSRRSDEFLHMTSLFSKMNRTNEAFKKMWGDSFQEYQRAYTKKMNELNTDFWNKYKS